MRSTRLLITIGFAAAIALSSPSLRAQDQSTGDPVADAARKAREKQKEAPKPKKVFTEDDIAPRPAAQPAPAAPVADASTPSGEVKADGTKPGGAPQDENPNSEQAWRKRFTEQHRKISDAEQELDVLQREAAKADVQYYSDPQKAMKEQFTRDEINKKNADIDAKKKEIADLKQQLSDMEDQLRATGGDPGWAR